MKDTEFYKDIINLPHHQSANRPRMSIYDRAAQFSAFAALKGYDDEIDEAARVTDVKIELDGAQIDELNEQLLLLKQRLREQPTVKITYFKPDAKKSGGAYLTVQGNLKKIDEYNRQLVLANGFAVNFDEIYLIEM